MNKNIKQTIFLISIIALLLLFLWFSGYQCPLLFFFGIPCPFCGMTRAFLCLLSGDLTTAFYYHPLWPVVLGIFPLFLPSSLAGCKILVFGNLPSGQAARPVCFLLFFLFGNSGFFTYRTNGSIMGLLRLEFCSCSALS